MSETAWCAAEDKRKNVREVVVEMNNPRPVESKFGKLMLGDNYRTLMASFWAVGLFRLERDPGPHLLLRADGHTTRFRAQPFRVAFCFYRMKAGGLFALFVDFPKLRIPNAPSAPFVLLETIRGIDLEDERQRIRDAIALPRLRLCFAEGEGPGEDLGSGVWSSDAIDALYDVPIDLDPQCREVLSGEWESLVEYHHTLSNDQRDFAASVRQMQAENPLTDHPIIDRAHAPEAQ